MPKKPVNIINYGVWIDQKKAIIGYFDLRGSFHHQTIYSGIETRLRFPGETTDKIRFGTTKLNRQLQKQNKLHNQMYAFCKRVKKQLKNMNAVLILGPSDAKMKLRQVLQEDKALKDVWIRTKAEDKMTLAEFKKAVMLHFA